MDAKQRVDFSTIGASCEVRWPLARLDFVQSPIVHFAPGLSLRSYSALPEQLGVAVDGGNLNAITKFDGGRPAHLEFVNHLPSALPYHLSNISSVLVCEPRGGLDLLTALYFDAPGLQRTKRSPQKSTR